MQPDASAPSAPSAQSRATNGAVVSRDRALETTGESMSWFMRRFSPRDGLPPHAGGERERVRVRSRRDVLARRVARADAGRRAVEPPRVLEHDLVGRLPVGAEDQAR